MKDHGEENIRLLKSFYEAVSRGEAGPARSMLDANVEWIEPNVPGLWFSGAHRGAEAVWNEVFAPAGERIDKFRVKMKKFYALGDHVIAFGHIHGRVRTTAKQLDAATGQICTIRNGKIVRVERFHDAESWLEPLGLVHLEAQRLAA